MRRLSGRIRLGGMTSLDHLVIVARSLDDGVAWCEATLGITPAPGGAHPNMGTHNRLFAVSSERFPMSYAEVLAVDASATRPNRPRWFDLDDPKLQGTAVPFLAAYAVRSPDAEATHAVFVARGLDPGPLTAASRLTPRGTLEWKLTIPTDGKRLLAGVVPAIIQWGAVHPNDSLPASGVTLESLSAAHPRAADLAALGLGEVTITDGPPDLVATFATPKGRVVLESRGR